MRTKLCTRRSWLLVALAVEAGLPAERAREVLERREYAGEVRDADALWALLVAGEIEFFVANEGAGFDSPRPRVDLLGRFPVALMVRAGHARPVLPCTITCTVAPVLNLYRLFITVASPVPTRSLSVITRWM